MKCVFVFVQMGFFVPMGCFLFLFFCIITSPVLQPFSNPFPFQQSLRASLGSLRASNSWWRNTQHQKKIVAWFLMLANVQWHSCCYKICFFFCQIITNRKKASSDCRTFGGLEDSEAGAAAINKSLLISNLLINLLKIETLQLSGKWFSSHCSNWEFCSWEQGWLH